MPSQTFTFTESVWLYPGSTAAWHFISLPKKLSADLKRRYGARARGWGSLPVAATIGRTVWKTSIFPDKRSETYLLPLKALVRRAEDLRAGDRVRVRLAVGV